MTAGPEEHDSSGCVPARLSARMAAGLIDMVLAALCAAAAFVAGFVVLTLPVVLSGSADGDLWAGEFFPDSLLVGAAGAVVASVAAVALYGPLRPMRWGQTPGRRIVSIAVVSHPGSGTGELRRGKRLARWALPHGAFVLAAVAGNAVADARDWWQPPIWLSAGVAAWTAVHGSVLLDPQRRGWHDRVADAMVVAVKRSSQRCRQAARRQRRRRT